MNTKQKQARKDFEKKLEILTMRESYSTVFHNFLDYALWAFNLERSQADEAAIMQQIHNDNKEYYSEMLIAMSIVADNGGIGFYDALGDLFMEYISHGRNDQYFTPGNICDMMAAMIISDDPTLIIGKSVCDPTCGSGRLLLATAKRAASLGVRDIEFYGADIDPVCCKMTALNMLLNSMCGEVAHMDPLRMEHWKSWHISRILLPNGIWWPTYRVSGAGETNFIQRLQTAIQQQNSKTGLSVDTLDHSTYRADKRGQLYLF